MFNTDFFYYCRLMFYFLMSASLVIGNQKQRVIVFYCEMKLFKAELQGVFMLG